MKIGIIGSTGLDIGLFCEEPQELEVVIDSKKAGLKKGVFNGNTVYFVSRNLNMGACPPHGVDYMLIMKLLKSLEVDTILATSVVGSLKKEYMPGQYVILDQFLDFTKHRVFTAFSNSEFAFVDFTYPYCESLRQVLEEACVKSEVQYHSTGCYVGVDGPRYETAAEVRAYGILGGDVVGMTNIPEVVLAREMGMCYASVALVVNYGAGITGNPILRKECYDETMKFVDRTALILKNALACIESRSGCDCSTKAEDMVR